MKPDSLATALLVSTAMVFDTTAQSITGRDTVQHVRSAVPSPAPPTHHVQPSQPSAPKEVRKGKTPKGTFRASSLFWSPKNKELYVEGDVRVNIGRNDFEGNGSFTFLGPVHFVVVNDTPLAIGSSISLTKQPHRLTMLNSREASDKYGDRGRQGAVEIKVLE